MRYTEVAFLGPTGTYSHLVADKYFGKDLKLAPQPSIVDVCKFVTARPTRCGIIPSENSSGGAIYETVDILLEGQPPVKIIEEVSLQVKLALLGHHGADIERLYSHFAPMEHCDAWITSQLPHVDRRIVSSTAVAAQQASDDPRGAALGSRHLAGLYALDVIGRDVQADIPNLTSFYAIGGAPAPQGRKKMKTTLAVRLANSPGSLCSFLETFRDEAVNLSCLISRPIRGCPKEYIFLVDVAGAGYEPKVARALDAAVKRVAQMRIIGTYPVHAPYKS